MGGIIIGSLMGGGDYNGHKIIIGGIIMESLF